MLVVLIVVVALSVTVYTFTRHMLIDLAITRSQVAGTQQQLLADSIVEQLLASDRQTLQRFCSPFSPIDAGQASTFETTIKVGEQSAVASINLANDNLGYMAVLTTDPRSETRQLGLSNQSAKLNLCSLAGKRLSRQQAIAKLMKYKDLSPATAEGIANILGVFDSQADVASGSQARGNVAQLSPRPGITSLVQLLSVPGVTEERLFGEDRNANGILDGNENDGETTWPPDNRDGVLDAGWSADWTLIGAESNYQQSGERKIDLNQMDLPELFDRLSQFATPEQARFVVAWRISSPIYTDTSSLDENAIRAEAANELATSFDDRLAKQLGIAAAPTTGSETLTDASQTKIRAGLDLAVTPARKFRSLLDLASCQLQLVIEGKDTILVSPFASDPNGLASWLPLWEAKTSVAPGLENSSRINIIQASEATLTTVEGISDELAKAIVQQRALLRTSLDGGEASPNSVAWLLEAGLVSTSELRRMADEITVGGDVFQGYAVGQLENSHTAHIKFIELDGRSGATHVRRAIDLPPLSRVQRLPIANR